MLNEADTRAKLIDPTLHASGWIEDKIVRDKYITPGRLIDENGKRLRGKKPDYILLYEQSFPIAVAEAKEAGKSALEGVQQAKDYAETLGVLFAYSTNGHQIEEFDYTTNSQKTIEHFPTSEELFERYLRYLHGGAPKRVEPFMMAEKGEPYGKKTAKEKSEINVNLIIPLSSLTRR